MRQMLKIVLFFVLCSMSTTLAKQATSSEPSPTSDRTVLRMQRMAVISSLTIVVLLPALVPVPT